MASSKRHIFLRGFLIGLILILPVLVLAQDTNFIVCTGPQGTTQPCDLNSLLGKGGLLDKVVNYTVTYLLVPIATGAILYAGIRLVWFSNRPEIKTEMKRLGETVVWGMIIVFAAYLIIQTIITSLATNSTEPGRAALQIFNSNGSGQ